MFDCSINLALSFRKQCLLVWHFARVHLQLQISIV